jgi:hypothetical protein
MTVMEPETADETEHADGTTNPDLCATRDAVHPRPGGEDRYTISEVAACTELRDTLAVLDYKIHMYSGRTNTSSLPGEAARQR